MIQLNTLLTITDNSGVKQIRNIKILDKNKKISIGNKIIASAKKVLPNKKIKSGDLVKALIIRQKKSFLRKDGLCLSFKFNSAIILSEKGIPIGSRIFGSVPREIRSKKYMKIVSLAQGII